MVNHLLLPTNLDLDSIVANSDQGRLLPKNVIAGRWLEYICHLVTQQKMCKKYDSVIDDGEFVPLSSRVLRTKTRYYKQCIDFLLNQNVLRRDGYFILGRKCYCYNFANQYLGEGFREVPVCKSIKISIQAHKTERLRQNPILRQLYNNRVFLERNLLSPLLQVNEDAANVDISLYGKNVFAEKQKKCLNIHYVAAEVESRKAVFRQMVKDINAKRFEVVIDETGHRLYSPLTRLPRFLRKHLTYDGKGLVALDLKNSQPYFALLLLQPEFYNRKKQKKGGLTLKQVDGGVLKLLRNQVRLPPVVACNACVNNNRAIITLYKILQLLADDQDASFQNYQTDVINGALYDRFIEVKDDQSYSAARDDLKVTFMRLLYGRPTNAKWTKKFVAVYDYPLQVFNLIKSIRTGEAKRVRGRKATQLLKAPPSLVEYPYKHKGSLGKNKPHSRPLYVDSGYCKLSHVLQRIEAHLLLDVVCKNVYKSNRKIPLFTIHDSIATTDEHVDFVEKVIVETLTPIVGHPPKLKKEYWSTMDPQALS